MHATFNIERIDLPPRRPDFLGIGSAKSGTTTLHDYLATHPDVTVPKIKELMWYNNALGRDRIYYEKQLASERMVTGEITPEYLYFLKKIAKDYPSVKLILCVRNPIDRLYSEIRHYRLLGLQKNPYISKIIHLPPEEFLALSPNTLIAGYYQHIVMTCRALSMPLLVLDFDDICNNQDKMAKEVCEFLGIKHHSPDSYIHANIIQAPGPEFSDSLIEELTMYYRRSNRFMLDEFGIDLSKR
jgi:hypothetical protein